MTTSADHFSVVNPVEEMIKRLKLAERTTGLAQGAYRKRFCILDFARP